MAARSPATLAAAPDAPLRRAWLPRRHPKPGAAGGGPGGAGRACCRAATLLLLLLALLAAPRLLLLPSPPRAAAPAPPPPAAATTALAVSSPPPPPPADPVDVALAGFAANSTLFVTFATSSMTLFLLNWAAHARAAGISPLLVGAFDEPVLRACAGAQLPAVYLAAERVVGGGYVSVHHPAFKRMGVQKVIFLQRLLARGVHVALSDADALWVADPRPFFSGKGLDKADVLVSTDCIDMDADRLTDGGGPCNRRVNFNTDKWLEKLLEGAEQNITWMRDQPAFNLMARGMGKADVNFTAPERPGDRALLLVANGTTKLGVLPPGQFMSGHVYFVQATPAQRAAAVAVHATFQFGDTDAFAYGKRTRLRQHGLWLAPEEAGYGRPRLLVLRDAPLFPTSDVKDEATNTTDATLDLLEKHFAADLEWRTRLQAGLAAARVLNRTLVVPRAACYCDRSWSPLVRCRLAGATLTALPFECPFDHVLESSRWDGAAGLPYRTIGFQPHPRATRARVRLGGPAPPAAGEREGWDAVIAAPPAGGYSDAALRAALAPHAGAEVLELGGAVAPVACLRRDLAVEGWYTWAATAPGLLAVLTSLLDVRIAYCCELNWLARRALPTVGGMVAKHCGAAEEKVGSSNPRSPDFGRVRRRQDCPCEWGFQLPPPLPLVAGDACDAAGG